MPGSQLTKYILHFQVGHTNKQRDTHAKVGDIIITKLILQGFYCQGE